MAKSNAAFWAEKIERNRARDQETDSLLVAAGWTVVRAWEHESARDAADRVVTALSHRG